MAPYSHEERVNRVFHVRVFLPANDQTSFICHSCFANKQSLVFVEKFQSDIQSMVSIDASQPTK